MENDSTLTAEEQHSEALSAAADRACLYVTLSAASLIGAVFLMVVPRPVPSMTVIAVLAGFTFPVSACLACRHILKYIRHLHSRPPATERPE